MPLARHRPVHVRQASSSAQRCEPAPGAPAPPRSPRARRSVTRRTPSAWPFSTLSCVRRPRGACDGVRQRARPLRRVLPRQGRSGHGALPGRDVLTSDSDAGRRTGHLPRGRARARHLRCRPPGRQCADPQPRHALRRAGVRRAACWSSGRLDRGEPGGDGFAFSRGGRGGRGVPGRAHPGPVRPRVHCPGAFLDRHMQAIPRPFGSELDLERFLGSAW